MSQPTAAGAPVFQVWFDGGAVPYAHVTASAPMTAEYMFLPSV